MQLKSIQEKLKLLRDRIRSQGQISAEDEQELKSLIHDTLVSANDQLSGIQKQLQKIANNRSNDNRILTKDQRVRLDLLEKTGVGSSEVH